MTGACAGRSPSGIALGCAGGAVRKGMPRPLMTLRRPRWSCRGRVQCESDGRLRPKAISGPAVGPSRQSDSDEPTSPDSGGFGCSSLRGGSSGSARWTWPHTHVPSCRMTAPHIAQTSVPGRRRQPRFLPCSIRRSEPVLHGEHGQEHKPHQVPADSQSCLRSSEVLQGARPGVGMTNARDNAECRECERDE